MTSRLSEALRRRRGAHRAPRTWARRLAYLGAVVLVVGAGVLLVVRPWSRSEGPAEPAPSPALAGVAPDVVQWLDDEVSPDTPVTAAEDVRAALDAAGAGARVGTTEAGALQVVSGDPPRGAAVVARFEADGHTLSVVDPAPGTPTAEELDRRRSLAAAVLDNPVAGVTGRAADVLRRADVDARLLGLLAGLVARMDVHVADIPPTPGAPADSTPARRVLVDQAAGEPLTPGAAATDELVKFLEAQLPPFAPDGVEQTDDGVLVEFDYVSAPDALVTAGT